MKLEPSGIINIDYIEKIWALYRQNPLNVSSEWRVYFNDLVQSKPSMEDIPPRSEIGLRQQNRGFGPSGRICAGCGRAEAMSFLQYNVSLLVRNYRVRGHLLAKVNPLGNPSNIATGTGTGVLWNYR